MFLFVLNNTPKFMLNRLNRLKIMTIDGKCPEKKEECAVIGLLNGAKKRQLKVISHNPTAGPTRSLISFN